MWGAVLSGLLSAHHISTLGANECALFVLLKHELFACALIPVFFMLASRLVQDVVIAAYSVLVNGEVGACFGLLNDHLVYVGCELVYFFLEFASQCGQLVL